MIKIKESTIETLKKEVEFARTKFPSNKHMLAALAEELGETAEALLEHGNSQRSREEAIQVACVAIRIYEEGDGDFEKNGSQ